MLQIDTIKQTLPNSLLVTASDQGCRITAQDGDFIADIELDKGRLYTSIDLLTTRYSDLDVSEDDIDNLISSYEEAFFSAYFPSWKKAGFFFEGVEDASADPNYIMVTARLEAVCADEKTVGILLEYIREHLDDASGTISFL